VKAWVLKAPEKIYCVRKFLGPKRSLALGFFAPGQWHCVNTLRQSQTGLIVALEPRRPPLKTGM
jgi:hypothetical protein